MANLLTYSQSNAENAVSVSYTGLGAGGSATRDTTEFWEGAASLRVVSDGTGTFQFVDIDIPASRYTPGATYTFSVYMKGAVGGETLRFYCQADQNLPSNARIGSVTNVTLTTTWTRYTVTVTMPNPIPYDHIGIRADTGGTAQNATWFMDGLQIESGSTATPWVAGSGPWSGSGSFSGSANANLTAKQTLGGAASLSGSATTTLTPSGTGHSIWQGSASISGAADAALNPVGTFQGQASLSGSSSTNLDTQATFQGAASLSGSANAQLVGIIPVPEPRGLLVTLAGQDITDLVDEMTINIQSVLGQGAGVGSGGSGQSTTCAFNIMLGPVSSALGAGETITGPSLVRQGEVVIYDSVGTRVFGGYATKYQDATPNHQLDPVTKVNCHDYWQHLDRIQVNEVYSGMSDTAIIKALLTKYAPFIDQSLIPSTDNYIFPKKFLRAKTLREAIQLIADTTGFMVWVDPYTRLHYASPSSASTAPFDLSDDPNFVTSFPHIVTKFEQDDNSIINKVYFYGGRNVSDDFNQDLSVQANGSNKNFSLLYFPHDAADGNVHVIKNGVEQAVGSVFDTSAAGKLKSAGGTSDVLINRDAEVLIFDVAPAAGVPLICRYRYMTPLVLVLSSTKSQQKFGDWYEGKITDQNVFDTNTALQRCRVLLAQQSFGLVTLSATLWKSGLQAGQLVYMKNQMRGIDDTYVVQKVKLKPLGAGTFEYSLDLGAWNWNLIDLLIWQARNSDGSDDNTEEDMSVIQAQELADASTVAVVFNYTTRASGQYYSRTTAVGDGHDAHSGFFSITS